MSTENWLKSVKYLVTCFLFALTGGQLEVVPIGIDMLRW